MTPQDERPIVIDRLMKAGFFEAIARPKTPTEEKNLKTTIRPHFISICLVVTGLVYHHNGANDWLAPNTVPAGLSPQQLANELTANILFAAAAVIWALMPGKKEED